LNLAGTVRVTFPISAATSLESTTSRRMGNPDEIAKAAVFLASDDSCFATGIELFVDGGFAQV
jgi:NAD(P)-dependent dehydrogenase (short-subunit alcohol dehydrogenase family)